MGEGGCDDGGGGVWGEGMGGQGDAVGVAVPVPASRGGGGEAVTWCGAAACSLEARREIEAEQRSEPGPESSAQPRLQRREPGPASPTVRGAERERARLELGVCLRDRAGVRDTLSPGEGVIEAPEPFVRRCPAGEAECRERLPVPAGPGSNHMSVAGLGERRPRAVWGAGPGLTLSNRLLFVCRMFSPSPAQSGCLTPGHG